MSVFTITFVSISFAQTKSTIRLKNIGRAKISISKGKLSSKIDLSKHVEGCAYVKKRTFVFADADCSAEPANFELIDITEKNNSAYLIILSSASSNCNVCGQCGACRDSFSIIWLKLDKNLKLLRTQSEAVNNCDDIEVKKPKKILKNCEDTKFTPKFKNNLLTIEYETLAESKIYIFSHLEYNRKTPDKGFVIKTSKRKKSSL